MSLKVNHFLLPSLPPSPLLPSLPHYLTLSFSSPETYTSTSSTSTSSESERGEEDREDDEAPILTNEDKNTSPLKGEGEKSEQREKKEDKQTITTSSPKLTPLSVPKDKDHTPLQRRHKRVVFSQTPSTTSRTREDMSGDIFNNPSFIFLQLYHSSSLGLSQCATPRDTPLLLPATESIERALKVLDHIPPYNTHKIGVVYVGNDQVSHVTCHVSCALSHFRRPNKRYCAIVPGPYVT